MPTNHLQAGYLGVAVLGSKLAVLQYAVGG